MLPPLRDSHLESDECHFFTFITPIGFDTRKLARTLDSLVRVSRRVNRDHLRSGSQHEQKPQSSPSTIKKVKESKLTSRNSINSYLLQLTILHRLNSSWQYSRTHTSAHDKTNKWGHHGKVTKATTPTTTHTRHQTQTDDVTTRSNGLYPLPFSSFKYFWLSFQSPFHLSLTVLVNYRSITDI